MNQFAIIRLPDESRWMEFFPDRRVVGLRAAYPEEVDSSGVVMTFQREMERDVALESLAKTYPGARFVPVKFESIYSCTPGPIKKFSVNERGVLPA